MVGWEYLQGSHARKKLLGVVLLCTVLALAIRLSTRFRFASSPQAHEAKSGQWRTAWQYFERTATDLTTPARTWSYTPGREQHTGVWVAELTLLEKPASDAQWSRSPPNH